MWHHIQKENNDIMNFIHDNNNRVSLVKDNKELCGKLKISYPNKCNHHIYAQKDIKVYLYE